MDFNTLSNRIFNGETDFSIQINSNRFNIIVFEDEFLLKINDSDYNYFDTINGLYEKLFINSIPSSQNYQEVTK